MMMTRYLRTGLVLLASIGIDGLAVRAQCSSAGLTLPAGFCATVFAEDVGYARHLSVSPAGDVFVAIGNLTRGRDTGGITALRDVNNDGRADSIISFGSHPTDDIEWRNGFLYASTVNSIVRYKLPAGQYQPSTEPETVVRDLPTFEETEHRAKTFALDAERLFVHIGAPSNSCQDENRVKNSPGLMPCPMLKNTAGIWLFPVHRVNMTLSDGELFVSGLRHTMGISILPSKAVYALVHGRDFLHENWPNVYSAARSADLPADEIVEMKKGANYGWPYCYYDGLRKMRVLAPEYGGDGEKLGSCAEYTSPVVALPAHSAPNDMLVYDGSLFPEKYRGGAFIALHGGWGRRPLPQRGFQIIHLRFSKGVPTESYEVFADGFAGVPAVRIPPDAKYRPTGLAQGPDGAVFVADSRTGRIWRIFYRG